MPVRTLGARTGMQTDVGRVTSVSAISKKARRAVVGSEGGPYATPEVASGLLRVKFGTDPATAKVLARKYSKQRRMLRQAAKVRRSTITIKG